MTLSVHCNALVRGDAIILHDIDLALERGKVTAILGPNGAGKTSLIRVLAGLDGAAGTVTIAGTALSDMTSVERARRLAYLPQDAQPAWNVTARELVALGRLPHRTRFASPTPADDAAVSAGLSATDTAHLAERTLDAMSGGERARVMLARVIAGEPEWLLADEPMASLDPAHRLDIAQLLREQAKGGAGVVTVLHDLTLAARLADRVLVLRDGRMLADGRPEKVLTTKLIAQAFDIHAEIRTSADGSLSITPLARCAS